MNVVVTARAEKQLQALDPAIRQVIQAIINSMEINLHSLPKKKLQDKNDTWRIRKGDWRITYQEDKQKNIVYVRGIRQRKDAYR